jgi:hypothetical protein
MQCEACGAACTADFCRDCDVEAFDKWQRQFDSELTAVEAVAFTLRTLAPIEADITF